MRWILLDLALVGLPVGGLGIVLLGLWRKVKELGRALARAGELADQASGTIAVGPPPRRAQVSAPPARATGRSSARHR